MLFLVVLPFSLFAPAYSASVSRDRDGASPTIAIIGATSKTGRELIPRALERGYSVVAVARRPEAVDFEHERLRVAYGDVYEPASLEAALRGNEVVISMVGPRLFNPATEVTEFDLLSTTAISLIATMKKKGNRRLIIASSTGAQTPDPSPPSGDNPSMSELWVWNLRKVYGDMRLMEELTRASGLDNIVLRPGFLVEEPERGDLRLTITDDGAAGTPTSRLVTYADFAEFTLAQVESDRYLGKTVGIWSDRKLKLGDNVNPDDYVERAKELAGQPGGAE